MWLELKETREPLVEILYYTDPYCTWCWGSEPILRRLREVYGEQIKITYKMGGLVENIDNFYDPTNRISGIEQVAPHWQEASQRHSMPVDIKVFEEIKKDFRSTYPANIAYKAAQFQGDELAERFLRRIREAAASERKHIHRPEVLLELAGEVGLDKERFARDLKSKKAEGAFRADLYEARSRGIYGFPAFVVKNQEGQEIMLKGYNPFEAFVRVFERLAGSPLRERKLPNIENFVKKYGQVATKEVAEVFGLSPKEAKRKLRRLERAGSVKEIVLGNGSFWRPVS